MQFDPLVIVVDWLDACRNGDTEFLVNLYDSSASLHCDCTDENYKGRAEIESYWRARLQAQVSTAFEIDKLYHEGDAVFLSCTSYEGKPIRIRFWFTEAGLIKHSLCGPSSCIKAA
jgi:ketosteroid isomerase-like protein